MRSAMVGIGNVNAMIAGIGHNQHRRIGELPLHLQVPFLPLGRMDGVREMAVILGAANTDPSALSSEEIWL